MVLHHVVVCIVLMHLFSCGTFDNGEFSNVKDGRDNRDVGVENTCMCIYMYDSLPVDTL